MFDTVGCVAPKKIINVIHMLEHTFTLAVVYYTTTNQLQGYILNIF